MNFVPKMDRRSFVIGTAAVGGGLTLGFDLPLGPKVVRAADDSPEIGVWVVIRPDETVVIRTARSEMGQGSVTGLAQLIAEELECDWSKVVTEYVTPGQSVARKRAWGAFSSTGSRSIRESQEYVRQGGAAARTMLIQAAANEWKVPASECSASNSAITHTSGKKTTYGKVAEAAAKLEVPKDVKLKDPKDWKIAGKPLKRLDTADKVVGKMEYGIDVKLPGMLNASIKACPVFGGKVKSFDAAKAEKMPGVKKVVKVDENAVAVVADTFWHAKTALEAVSIEWDTVGNEKVSSATIAKFLEEGLTAEQAFVGNKNGDVKAAIEGAAKKVEAVYSYPYQNHATMEPMNATALYTPDKCEVWCGTQDGEGAFGAVVQTSGLPANKCDVHKVMLGGGFGRRGRADYVIQAVQIAMQMPGTPIKLIWTREEDMQHGAYHPVTQCKMVGAFDKDNNLTGLHMRISGQSILASVLPSRMDKDGRDPVTFQGLNPSGETAFGYTVPNLLIDHAMRNPHVPAGFWRGVNVNHNAIYVECFMDELAHTIGVDALEFRRKLMSKNPKNLAVLNAVAERIGWGKPAEKGRFRGLSQMMAFGSYVAGAAEISVEGDKIKIHKLIGATDPGFAVNPAQIDRQVAGSFVYGLSALFYGEITVKDGAVEQGNFDTYNSLRIAEMPPVESILMPSGHTPWGGVGEPTILVAAPAVMNAYFNATGKRIRSFPLKNHNLQIA
jgi:isoquinoline 1-oxidoreductase beta subunit